jgi:hypothetical protein
MYTKLATMEIKDEILSKVVEIRKKFEHKTKKNTKYTLNRVSRISRISRK